MLCILNRLGSTQNGGTILHKKKRKTAFWQTASAAARNSISMRAFCWLIIKEPFFFKVLKKAYLFVTSTRFQQKRWQLMTQLGKRSLAEMTSNDKPCVHMDSLVVLHNISNGQLVDVLVLRGLIRQTPSINLWNKLGC